jgi:hypothetical protein
MAETSPLLGFFECVLGVMVVVASVVWLVFPFIIMNRMRWMRDEIEKTNQVLAKISTRLALAERYAARPSAATANVTASPTVQPYPTVKPYPIAKPYSPDKVVPPPSVVPLKISKGGLELGLKDTTSIKVMLKTGELTLKDQYFDREINAWVTLDCNPEFS